MKRALPVLFVLVLAVATVAGYAAVVQRSSVARAIAISQSDTYPIPLMTVKSSIPKVAVIGDSYAAGAGASDRAHQFVTILAAKMGWSVTSFARGGTGYSQSIDDPKEAPQACGLSRCVNYVAQIHAVAKSRPDIVLVWGGRNDSQTGTAQEALAVKTFYRELRSTLPNTQIYAALPIWGADMPPSSMTAIAADVSMAAAENRISVVRLGQPLSGRKDLMFEDGVHPNDKGHVVIASLMARALARDETLR